MGRNKTNNVGVMIRMDNNLLTQLRDDYAVNNQMSQFIEEAVKERLRKIRLLKHKKYTCDACFHFLKGNCTHSSLKIPCEHFINHESVHRCGWCFHYKEGICTRIKSEDKRRRRGENAICIITEFIPNPKFFGGTRIVTEARELKRSLILVNHDLLYGYKPPVNEE